MKAWIGPTLSLFVLGCISPITSSAKYGNRISLPAVIQDLDGRSHSLSQLFQSGKTVAFVFWQTWCPSCKSEIPELANAWQKHGTDITFFGVVPGPNEKVDDAKVRAISKEWGIPYPIVRDRDLRLTKAMKISGTPSIVLVGPDQEVRYHDHAPPRNWSLFVSGAVCTKDGCEIPGTH